MASYFEVTISPPVARPLPVECTPVLMLAPFSSVPKVDFDGIKLGTLVKREVIIRNPTSGNIIIDLVVPSDMVERGFRLNALRFNLAPGSQTNLEVEWKPIEAGQWRDTIRVIHVNGKSKFAHISVTSSSINLTKRPPLRRILQPTASDRRNIKSFSNIDTLKNPQTIILKKKLSAPNLIEKSLIDKEEEISENFVVGVLPECNISPIQDSRKKTYVKHPGFPPFQCNLPVIHSGEEEIKHLEKTYNISKDALSHTKDLHSKNLDRDYIDLESKDLSLELSDVQLSPVKSISLNKKLRRPSSASLIDNDLYEVAENFERDSLENPNLSSLSEGGFRGSLCDISRPQTPPLSNNASLFNLSVSKSLTKFNRTKSETFTPKAKKRPIDLLPLLISSSKSNVITSTAKKKEDLICSLSPKSRVQFKKGPQRLFRNVKGNPSGEHIKLIPENQKCLKLLTSSEKTGHPLGFYHETSYENPFAKNAIHTSAFLEKQTFELIKWLNSVLTPPEELSSEDCGVNIEKLWKKSINSDVLLLAPSKEEISSKYHSDEGRLMSVRKAAIALYESDRIAKVLHCIYAKIEIGFLDVKDDIDLYCDQGVRYKLVELILYYNPLWLRIGLETIFKQIIQMPSKNSIGALIYFIKKHFLSDDEIIKKNTYSKSTSYKMPNFKREMNNFITFKFLTLVFFLDQAKTERLIRYDPCLFRKSALIKESEGILNEFIKEFIKCVGAQKKTLAAVGYCLKHKQTYLDEFDFSVLSFQDLRDGIRLARAMEIILKKNCLSPQLRTPAVSRLQKIHNVKVTLETLRNEGYIITEDITANDIVDGHKEKIMSLLWQILHRFLGPRYLRSAVVIQKWWRKILPKVLIERKKQEVAAVKIQAWWRGILLRKKIHLIVDEAKKVIENRLNSAMKIQKWYRNIILMRFEREKFLRLKHATVIIQKWYRKHCETRIYVATFKRKKVACVLIQKWYRNLSTMRRERENYLALKYYSIYIQRRFRSIVAVKRDRKEFQSKRLACIRIQQWYRSVKTMCIEKKQFQDMRIAALVIQKWYRAIKIVQIERQNFLNIKHATILLQRRYRSLQAMKNQRMIYNLQKNACIKIQQWYRSIKIAQRERQNFLDLKYATILLQRRYRSLKMMRNQRMIYNHQRNASIKIQQWYRSTKIVHLERKKFLDLKKATIVLQRRYRSLQAMRNQRMIYNRQRNASIIIQQWYRSMKTAHIERKEFLELKQATIVLQRRYRSLQAMRNQKMVYNSQRNSCIKIQQWYRSIKIVQREQQNFLDLKHATILLQRRYRSLKAMRNQRMIYNRQRNACIQLQQWYRSIKIVRRERQNFLDLKHATILLQRRYRSLKARRNERMIYYRQRNACIKIQQWYRSTKAAHIERKKFLELKQATIVLQRKYRSLKAMRNQRLVYNRQRNSSIKIQKWYRNIKLTKEQKKSFIVLKLVRESNESHLNEKNLFLVVEDEKENIVKGIEESDVEFNESENILEIRRKACTTIVNWWKTIIAVRNFRMTKRAVIKIQLWYRGWVETRRVRNHFLEKLNACVKIQTWYRFIVEQRKLTLDRCAYISEEENKQYVAAVAIQSLWRGFIWRKKNTNITQDIKKKSEEAAKAESLGFANQRLTDLFDDTIKFLALDNPNIKQFKVLFNTMKKLDYCTLYSPVLCEKLVQIPNFFVIAWVTLDKQTRSDPYIKVFEHILNILVNLARYDKTPSVYESFLFFNGQSILGALMGKSIGKHSSLFCKCVCLLWIIFKKDELIANQLKSDSEFMKRLNFYYKQINKRLSKKKSQRRDISQLMTDWGLKRFNREFSDESAAITLLFQVLNISIRE